MFHPLTRDNICNIIDLLLEDLNHRLEDRELQIELTGEAKKLISFEGYDPMYGARPLKRYLQKNVETLAARMILSDQVRSGEVILIDAVDGKLEASVKGQMSEV
jgi:ATP-dependent Clp protease ATP-binding subunit ClpB